MNEIFEKAAAYLEGTVMTSPRQVLKEELERDPTAEELALFEIHLSEIGMQECNSCGWWQSENEGVDGNLCWHCAEDEEEFQVTGLDND